MIVTSLFSLIPLLPSPAGDPVPPPAASLLLQGDGPADSSFHYDYAEGGFTFGDLDGVRFAGSKRISGPWIGVGRLEYLTEDEGRTETDLVLLSGGVGYVFPAPESLGVEQALDFIGSVELEYGRVEVDTPGGNFDDDDVGLRFRAGARFQATEKIEVEGGVSLATIFDDDLGVDGRVLYAFNPKFSAFAGFEDRDDTFLRIGVRYGF